MGLYHIANLLYKESRGSWYGTTQYTQVESSENLIFFREDIKSDD